MGTSPQQVLERVLSETKRVVLSATGLSIFQELGCSKLVKGSIGVGIL